MAYGDTVNRGWLKRQVLAGKVEAKCTGRYTDDYAYDASVGYGKTDWMPAFIIEDVWRSEAGKIGIFASDFRGKSGKAWQNRDGSVTLYCGNESFELRIVGA